MKNSWESNITNTKKLDEGKDLERELLMKADYELSGDSKSLYHGGISTYYEKGDRKKGRHKPYLELLKEKVAKNKDRYIKEINDINEAPFTGTQDDMYKDWSVKKDSKIKEE